MSADPVEFFQKKKPWSKYKDLILDYYLKPYLAKIATIRRPVAVINCFAGPGRFNDGEPGSPLIICKHLAALHARGVTVRGLFIETNQELYGRLTHNLSKFSFPLATHNCDFLSRVDEIAEIANTHSAFVYVDPIAPGDLAFNDLRSVYEKLQRGRSVETLVNFLSRGFVRRAMGLMPRATKSGALDSAHPEVVACNDIAGGTYWQDLVLDKTLKQGDRTDQVAEGYANHLHQWFRWVLTYGIRERPEGEQPKYHLVFGSRHPDAVDLMNRAMVTARRELVRTSFIEGMLFPNEPMQEVIEPRKTERCVLETSRRVGKTTWELLRIHATIDSPCMYTDSEWNRAIKAAIKQGKLHSSCDGHKIDRTATVWVQSTVD